MLVPKKKGEIGYRHNEGGRPNGNVGEEQSAETGEEWWQNHRLGET